MVSILIRETTIEERNRIIGRKQNSRNKEIFIFRIVLLKLLRDSSSMKTI